MIYLDNAATTPVRPEVLEAMLPYLTGWFGNPSSHHGLGEAAARALADARAASRRPRMRPGDVVFTSGGTEADNLAVKGIALANPRGRHVVMSPIEHEAVLESAAYLARVHGFEVDEVGGRRAAASCIPRPSPASCGPTPRSSRSAREQRGRHGAARRRARRGRPRAGALVHTTPCRPPAGCRSRSTLGVDALSLAGHKVGAPKGTGALVVRGRIPLEPLLHGGGQERGRRWGTENVAGAVAFATALRLAEAERADAAARVGALGAGSSPG